MKLFLGRGDGFCPFRWIVEFVSLFSFRSVFLMSVTKMTVTQSQFLSWCQYQGSCLGVSTKGPVSNEVLTPGIMLGSNGVEN